MVIEAVSFFKLFLANVVPCSLTNVLVVSTEFEPVNPSFGEDETQTPDKYGTPTFGEDGTPGLGAWPVDSTCFVRWHSGQKDVSTL